MKERMAAEEEILGQGENRFQKSGTVSHLFSLGVVIACHFNNGIK
jgi:hypothetical protein